jgi:regulator of protease activity HflC (stomatin/prohibitin superfamily)
MLWLLLAIFVIYALNCIRMIQPHERAVILRSGNIANRVVGPGVVLFLPFVERLHRVSIEPLSLSLPIQSAITRDEVPIQLQASLDAKVNNPELALKGARDWRVHLISQLQILMKDRLEDLDFDRLDSSFAEWTRSIRIQMNDLASMLGIEITGLSISNLSPRTRPE